MRFRMIEVLGLAAVLLGASGDSSAADPTPPPPAAQTEQARVEALLVQPGKKAVIQVLREKRFGRVTILMGNEMRDALGPPNPQLVNAATVLNDLALAKMTVAELEQAVVAAGPTSATPVAITMQDVGTAPATAGTGGAKGKAVAKGWLEHSARCPAEGIESCAVEKLRSILQHQDPGRTINCRKAALQVGSTVSIGCQVACGSETCTALASWQADPQGMWTVRLRVPDPNTPRK
jgi:hypothetical protein